MKIENFNFAGHKRRPGLPGPGPADRQGRGHHAGLLSGAHRRRHPHRRPGPLQNAHRHGGGVSPRPVPHRDPARGAKPQSIKKMQTILEQVVSLGLGKKAGSPNFKVAGKTGTASIGWMISSSIILYIISIIILFYFSYFFYDCSL